MSVLEGLFGLFTLHFQLLVRIIAQCILEIMHKWPDKEQMASMASLSSQQLMSASCPKTPKTEG